ncbi:MAG: type II toxin-antitoxin system VapC family toxin [Phycisphaerae bacterium]
MARPSAFVDTSAMLALVNRDDALHDRAKQVNRTLAEASYELVTSDWVLAEFLGGAAPITLRQAACRLIRRLQNSPRAIIIPATRSDWKRAFDLYTSRPDKAWSFVDCSSILFCQDRDIHEVFTHDHHFTQAGLVVLIE